MVGDSSVGKTSLIETFCKGEFNSWPSATVASDLYKAEIEINGKKVTVSPEAPCRRVLVVMKYVCA